MALTLLLIDVDTHERDGTSPKPRWKVERQIALFVASRRHDTYCLTVLLNDTRAQVLDGTMACLARWGLSKTTLDDIASASDCSRATIYRLFPGGKDALFGALVQREVAAFFHHVGLRLEATESLEERLREGMTAALEQIWSHPALRFLVEHEPNAVVRNPATAGLHQILEVATSFLEPHLADHLPAARARAAADWVVRLTLSYATTPPTDSQRDRTIADVVEHLLLPGIASLAEIEPTALTGA